MLITVSGIDVQVNKKNIKNMREKGCLVSSVREDFDDVTVLTIKISKKAENSDVFDF